MRKDIESIRLVFSALDSNDQTPEVGSELGPDMRPHKQAFKLYLAVCIGASGKGPRLLRTVSSSFPAGAAFVASPSGAHRQRACRTSIDALRSASSGVSKLVASHPCCQPEGDLFRHQPARACPSAKSLAAFLLRIGRECLWLAAW